ncbi:unnamed protein product [Owenia fusiformis]|uniref:Uncharacterized protein n=1 Tax=Owenia fusiformis TaxID=6347 RepID=A0A8J1V003_OWEFU|nr:unnamed protein product [Owenia fusiformis]
MSNETETQGSRPTGFGAPIVGTFFLLALFIVITNGLVIISYVISRRVRQVTSTFLFNLVVVDFHNGLISVPLAAFKEETTGTNYVVGKQFCVVASIWLPLMTKVATYSVVALSLDRLISILKPFRYREIVTNRRTYVALSFIWMFSLIDSCFPAFGLPTFHGEHHEVIAQCTGSYNYGRIYLWWYIITSVAIPLVCIIVIYSVIYHIAKGHNQQIIALEVEVKTKSASEDASSKERKKIGRFSKAAKTAFVISSLFCICWIQFIIVFQLMAMCIIDRCSVNIYITIIPMSSCLALLISGINPIVFAIRTPVVKEQVKRLLCVHKCTSSPIQVHPERSSLEQSNIT